MDNLESSVTIVSLIALVILAVSLIVLLVILMNILSLSKNSTSVSKSANNNPKIFTNEQNIKMTAALREWNESLKETINDMQEFRKNLDKSSSTQTEEPNKKK